jgi:hypothetical protein
MFEHLILLMGTNPLPNFIVAEYYLQNNPALKNIWLVHSEKTNSQEGTYTYAENLVNALKLRHPHKSISFNFIPLSDISNAGKILSDVKKLLIAGLKENSSVHLNYTGGTKVMGTHVYLALKQEEKRLSKSFSYLDARTFRIVNDEKGVITDDLRNKVSILFEELIKLHGFKRTNDDSDKDFSEAIKVFKNLIDEKRLDNYFKENGGYNRRLFESKNKEGKLSEKISELKEELKGYKATDTFFSVVRSMPEGHQLFDATGNFVTPVNNRQCESAIRFLDGSWFEDYIYTSLVNGVSDSSIKILKNREIKKDGWTGNFQLDVILIKGYQLIGISCTTSKEKHICKSKGFEIIHRAKQIGGDEAKAVLFTLLDDGRKLDLQDELLIDTGSTTANIIVFGIEDLNEDYIVKKIKEFIK